MLQYQCCNTKRADSALDSNMNILWCGIWRGLIRGLGWFIQRSLRDIQRGFQSAVRTRNCFASRISVKFNVPVAVLTTAGNVTRLLAHLAFAYRKTTDLSSAVKSHCPLMRQILTPSRQVT